jgi:hypothetical protein
VLKADSDFWKPISLADFNDRSGHAYPIAVTADVAIEQWAERGGVLLGVIVLNCIDQDYGYVALGRDEHNRFRAIDVACSYPSIEEARTALRAVMHEILDTGVTVFPQRLRPVTLNAAKLRAIVNLLSDLGSAANAAGILAREAKERGPLVADLVAQTMASPSAPSSSASQPTSRASWQDVDPVDADALPYTKRIGVDHVGLVSMILGETDKAWPAGTPDGGEAWFAKSVVENHGEDPRGRAILVIPRWPARRTQLI